LKRIVAFGASSSSKSINKLLATYAAQQINNSEITILDLNNFQMPIYSEDYEIINGIPEEAHNFKKIIKLSDGIIISLLNIMEHILQPSRIYLIGYQELKKTYGTISLCC